jgi:hypothetical protein
MLVLAFLKHAVQILQGKKKLFRHFKDFAPHCESVRLEFHEYILWLSLPDKFWKKN